MMFTCRIREAVRVPGVLAAGVSSLQWQLHNVRERPVTDLVGGGDFHQVDIPRLQLLQQGHCMASCKQKQKHPTRIRNTENGNRCITYMYTSHYIVDEQLTLWGKSAFGIFSG